MSLCLGAHSRLASKTVEYSSSKHVNLNVEESSMAKKIKPNKLFDADPAENAEVEDGTITTEEKLNDADAHSIIGAGRLSAEDIEKLEKYDAMEKSVSMLSSEKSMLESKLAEYAEKLQALNDASKKMNDLERENKRLEGRCIELEKSSSSGSSAKYEKQVAELREENDKLLVRISELTFENANLTCQLAELEKLKKEGRTASNSANRNAVPRNGLAAPLKDAYNPYVNNGYGTW